MKASYRAGVSIVLWTVVGSLALCVAVPPILASVRGVSTPPRAAQELEGGFPLGEFHLTERSGRQVTEADLRDRVFVTAFIFTRCPLSCPRISSVMKSLQGKFEGSDVRLVSITVDPDHDTPAILKEYADRFGADRDRWWFLTGPKPDVLTLIRDRFKLGVEPTSETEQAAGAEAFSHSERLALVDHGRVVGYFSSTDPKAVESLVEKAKKLAGKPAPAWVRKLPAVNAGLNGSCVVLLALALVLIRLGYWRGHAVVMTSAVLVSALFLTCYLVYHYHVGSVPFRGTGPVRLAYFTILLSHTLLATFGVVPLVTITLLNVIRKRFDVHARIARVTFPIWMYVSITGVVIYVMLYQLPLSTS